jgi:hypothetical protein
MQLKNMKEILPMSNTNFHKALLLFSLLILESTTITAQTQKPQVNDENSQQGIRVMLSVYSGRPNPEWWVTSSTGGKEITAIIQELKAVADTSLFDYNRWNKLGYASFWIFPVRMEKMPYAIHVWRDMAVIFPTNQGDKPLYAKNALKLYDILVAQAEKKELNSFFVKYHKGTSHN